MINHNSIDQTSRPALVMKQAGVEKQILQSLLFFVVTFVPVPLVYFIYKTCPW